MHILMCLMRITLIDTDRDGAVSAAWLYGSVVRGEDAPDSDVDIALVVRSQAVADQVGMDEVIADVLPADKAAKVEARARRY